MTSHNKLSQCVSVWNKRIRVKKQRKFSLVFFFIFKIRANAFTVLFDKLITPQCANFDDSIWELLLFSCFIPIFKPILHFPEVLLPPLPFQTNDSLPSRNNNNPHNNDNQDNKGEFQKKSSSTGGGNKHSTVICEDIIGKFV